MVSLKGVTQLGNYYECRSQLHILRQTDQPVLGMQISSLSIDSFHICGFFHNHIFLFKRKDVLEHRKTAREFDVQGFFNTASGRHGDGSTLIQMLNNSRLHVFRIGTQNTKVTYVHVLSRV